MHEFSLAMSFRWAERIRLRWRTSVVLAGDLSKNLPAEPSPAPRFNGERPPGRTTARTRPMAPEGRPRELVCSTGLLPGEYIQDDPGRAGRLQTSREGDDGSETEPIHRGRRAPGGPGRCRTERTQSRGGTGAASGDGTKPIPAPGGRPATDRTQFAPPEGARGRNGPNSRRRIEATAGAGTDPISGAGSKPPGHPPPEG